MPLKLWFHPKCERRGTEDKEDVQHLGLKVQELRIEVEGLPL